MAERPAIPPAPARLHINRGGYCGERVPVASILEELRREGDRMGWRAHELARSGPYPVWCLARPAQQGAGRTRRVYISTGIHGDEPAGPLAALELLRQNGWAPNDEVTLFPCLNPTGLAQNRREGPEGLDFNRDYRHRRTSLARTHAEWLEGQPDFDLALLLHEDWEADGFYLYELAVRSPNPMAEAVMSAVSAVCPILQADRADGWPARDGIVRPNVDPQHRPEWPEAIFLFQEKTDLAYTLEAPSDYPIATRVSALVTGVDAALSF